MGLKNSQIGEFRAKIAPLSTRNLLSCKFVNCLSEFRRKFAMSVEFCNFLPKTMAL